MSCLRNSRASLTFCVHFNTVAVGANVIFSFFDKSLNECNAVGTPGSGFGPSGEGGLWGQVRVSDIYAFSSHGIKR